MFNFLKNCFLTSVKIVVVGFFVLVLIGVIIGLTGGKSGSDTYSERSSSIGYLKAGANWENDKGTVYKNGKKVKIEMRRVKIVGAKRENLIQIYFLEGVNAGTWGWTYEEYVTRN
jgi:hypothetical protein